MCVQYQTYFLFSGSFFNFFFLGGGASFLLLGDWGDCDTSCVVKCATSELLLDNTGSQWEMSNLGEGTNHHYSFPHVYTKSEATMWLSNFDVCPFQITSIA